MEIVHNLVITPRILIILVSRDRQESQLAFLVLEIIYFRVGGARGRRTSVEEEFFTKFKLFTPAMTTLG